MTETEINPGNARINWAFLSQVHMQCTVMYIYMFSISDKCNSISTGHSFIFFLRNQLIQIHYQQLHQGTCSLKTTAVMTNHFIHCSIKLDDVHVQTEASYFWESCSRVAAFWAAGLCLAWFNQPWVLYSTQLVPWLWPSRKRWGFSPRRSRLAPATEWKYSAMVYQCCLFVSSESLD